MSVLHTIVDLLLAGDVEAVRGDVHGGLEIAHDVRCRLCVNWGLLKSKLEKRSGHKENQYLCELAVVCDGIPDVLGRLHKSYPVSEIMLYLRIWPSTIQLEVCSTARSVAVWRD